MVMLFIGMTITSCAHKWKRVSFQNRHFILYWGKTEAAKFEIIINLIPVVSTAMGGRGYTGSALILFKNILASLGISYLVR